MMGEWQDVSTAPKDDRFLASLLVRHISGKEWWDMHVVWLDDETGDIAIECEQGWSLSDYTHWMPLPTPPATKG